MPDHVRRLLRTRYRDFVFRRSMKTFMRDPASCTYPRSPVIASLIYGWGNEGWSALDEYLVCCIQHALNSSGPLLECGSGLSTILVGAIAKSRGYHHWALEHTPDWADRVQGFLDEYGIDSVSICTKPLKDYGEFVWYNPPLDSMTDSFALVICDGPPSTTKGGRYGLIPVMRTKLKPGCIILLDDAGREDEQKIAKQWEAELAVSSEFIGRDKPYIKLTLGE
jgi:hypothetical protein